MPWSHVLLRAGQQVLERLFPNLVNELIEDGSVVADFTNDLEWFHFGQWKKRFESGIRGVQQTRPFFESISLSMQPDTVHSPANGYRTQLH